MVGGSPQKDRVALTIDAPLLVLGEGKDEVNLVRAVLRKVGYPESDFQAIDAGGQTKLKLWLQALTKTPGFDQVRAIGIIRDADDNPGGALQSVGGALRSAGLAAPRLELEPEGNPISVVVLVSPGGNRKGATETLFLDAVSEDPALRCVDGYLECLQKEGIPSRGTIGQRDKARLGADPAPHGDARSARHLPHRRAAPRRDGGGVVRHHDARRQ